MHYSSVILLLAGLFSGLLFLGLSINTEFSSAQKVPKLSVLIGIIIAAVCTYLYSIPLEHLEYTVNRFPMDYYSPSGSDIIPQVGILVDRFMSGTMPYQPINEWTATFALYPTYLPLQWLPYTIAEILNLDYRLYVFFLFGILNLYLVKRSIRSKNNFWATLILGILPPLIILGIMINDTTNGFRFSVELLIVSYYMLLASCLVRFNWFSTSILIAVCLLSRYSVVLWVPLFLFVMYRVKGRNVLFKSMGVMFLMFCIFYLPFLIIDPMIYFKGYDYHTHAALLAWRILDWQPATDTAPYTLINGVGMGLYFYENIVGEVVDKLTAFRHAHLALSMGSVILSGFWYLKYEKRILPGVFLLGSLKIYLVVFYNFIQIPFIYLFWILPMISVVMLAVLFNLRSNVNLTQTLDNLDLNQQ